MSRGIFWTLCVVLLAAVVHLGYVLLVPSYEMKTKIDDIRSLVDAEDLTVLSREQGIQLLGPDGRWLVHALCIYDLSAGPVRVTAAVPNTYWSMTIYSATGETFYSLNDRQAGIDRVSIVLRETSDQESGEELQGDMGGGETLTVRAPDRAGLVVMRALAGEAAQFGPISQVLASSSCRSATG